MKTITLFFLEVTKNGKQLVCFKTAEQLANRKCGDYYPAVITDKRKEPEEDRRAWLALEAGKKSRGEEMEPTTYYDLISITKEFTR